MLGKFAPAPLPRRVDFRAVIKRKEPSLIGQERQLRHRSVPSLRSYIQDRPGGINYIFGSSLTCGQIRQALLRIRGIGEQELEYEMNYYEGRCWQLRSDEPIDLRRYGTQWAQSVEGAESPRWLSGLSHASCSANKHSLHSAASDRNRPNMGI